MQKKTAEAVAKAVKAARSSLKWSLANLIKQNINQLTALLGTLALADAVRALASCSVREGLPRVILS